MKEKASKQKDLTKKNKDGDVNASIVLNRENRTQDNLFRQCE